MSPSSDRRAHQKCFTHLNIMSSSPRRGTGRSLFIFFLDVSISDQESQSPGCVFGVCNATINSTLNSLTAQIRPIYRPAVCARSRQLPELRDSIFLTFFLDVSISDQEAQFSNEISQNLLVLCHQTLLSTGAWSTQSPDYVFGVCNATIDSALNSLTALIR